MNADSPDPVIAITQPAQEQPPAILDAGAPTHVTRAATAEEIRAVEVLFAEQGPDSTSAAGLVWALHAGMLAHDIVKDTFTPETREVEVEKEKDRKRRPR